MTWILAIDPGPTESAWALVDENNGALINWAKVPNDALLAHIDRTTADRLAVEMIASYGMAVGEEVFQTCVMVGRILERWSGSYFKRADPILVYRKDVKLHLCGSPRAKDANVRQALIDRYGPGKDKAIGLKSKPGPLYGLSGDGWAALGVALTVADTRPQIVQEAA